MCRLRCLLRPTPDIRTSKICSKTPTAASDSSRGSTSGFVRLHCVPVRPLSQGPNTHASSSDRGWVGWLRPGCARAPDRFTPFPSPPAPGPRAGRAGVRDGRLPPASAAAPGRAGRAAPIFSARRAYDRQADSRPPEIRSSARRLATAPSFTHATHGAFLHPRRRFILIQVSLQRCTGP